MAGLLRTEQRKRILEELSDGKSLRTICRAQAMPAISTVMEWCAKEPEWAEQYARARACGDDAMAEDIQEISDNAELDPQDRKVRIDARKWLLAKRQPKKYGDATTLKHADADGDKIPLDDTSKFTRLAAMVTAIQGLAHEPTDDAG
jgi:hypothetical protein